LAFQAKYAPVTHKPCYTETKSLQTTRRRKPHPVYMSVPFSMTFRLSDP